jgi:hypothetical protein
MKMPGWFAITAAALGAAAFSLSACMGGSSSSGKDVLTAAVESTPTETTGTTTSATPPPPPPLSHREFVKRLDSICKKANDKLDRRFGAASDAAVAAQDLDKLADLRVKARRLNAPFYAAVRKLRSRGVPDRDKAALRKYLALSHQLDSLDRRYIRALRQSDLDEIGRLNGITSRIRNKRTKVTSSVGLRQCGS